MTTGKCVAEFPRSGVPKINPNPAQRQVEEPKVWFSREQYEYLNKIFKEVITSPSTSNEELRHNAGKRHVVNFIKDKIRG